MTKLYRLQSGFVATNPTLLVRTPTNAMSLRESLYVPDTRVVDRDNHYDEGVNDLFHQWRKDNSLINTFEFRELLLKTAIRVFKNEGDSMETWIRSQLSQRTVGFLHRRFLKETLASVLNQEPRTMETYGYYRLLHAKNDADGLQTGKDYSNEELQNYIANGNSAKLSDILKYWTPNIHGYSDLLMTLHVIFGARDTVGDTTRNA